MNTTAGRPLLERSTIDETVFRSFNGKFFIYMVFCHVYGIQKLKINDYKFSSDRLKSFK